MSGGPGTEKIIKTNTNTKTIQIKNTKNTENIGFPIFSVCFVFFICIVFVFVLVFIIIFSVPGPPDTTVDGKQSSP